MVRKLVVEGVGTFFLVLTIGLVVLAGAGGFGPLAVAGVLAAMVYAGRHVSGAHYNPAVSLGVFLRGGATAGALGSYWIVQLAAGALAAWVVVLLHPQAEPGPLPLAVVPALLAEFLFTFALVFVFLNVVTARGTEGNSHYGAAVGLTVLAGAYAVGSISGAALNPAVALGFLVAGLIAPSSVWILLVAELLGGVAAALVFGIVDAGGEEVEAEEPTQADAPPEADVPEEAAEPGARAGFRPGPEPGR